jgi:hypothetical protein
MPVTIKPFVLDLGSAQVKVELASPAEMGGKLGLAIMNDYVIRLRAGQHGQAYAPVLWHEVLHWIDWLFLANKLDTKKGHRLLDQLANAIHMVLDRNPDVVEALYGKGRKRK